MIGALYSFVHVIQVPQFLKGGDESWTCPMGLTPPPTVRAPGERSSLSPLCTESCCLLSCEPRIWCKQDKVPVISCLCYGGVCGRHRNRKQDCNHINTSSVSVAINATETVNLIMGWGGAPVGGWGGGVVLYQVWPGRKWPWSWNVPAEEEPPRELQRKSIVERKCPGPEARALRVVEGKGRSLTHNDRKSWRWARA